MYQTIYHGTDCDQQFTPEILMTQTSTTDTTQVLGSSHLSVDEYNSEVVRNIGEDGAEVKMWNASRFCVSSLRRGHANLLCIVPILVYVLPKQIRVFP